VLAPREHPGGEPGQQARLHCRRLAAPGRADDAQERRAHQAGDHVRHELLATEEDAGVLHVERGQPLERARHHTGGAMRLGALANVLQLDDAAGQLVLRGPQVRALRRRVVCGTGQPSLRPLSRPFVRSPVHESGYPAALLGQPRDGDLHVAGRITTGYRGHGRGVEWGERDRLVSPEDIRRFGADGRSQDEQGQGPQPLAELGERVLLFARQAVDVVENDEGGVARRPRLQPAQTRGVDALRLGERVANDAGDDDADDQRPEAESDEEPEPEGAESEPHGQDQHGQRRQLRRPLVPTALAHDPSITPPLEHRLSAAATI
jgi:hypothetical protein